jgi:hypothetical protein
VERKLRAVEALPDERIADLLQARGQGEEEEPNTEGKDHKRMVSW